MSVGTGSIKRAAKRAADAGEGKTAPDVCAETAGQVKSGSVEKAEAAAPAVKRTPAAKKASAPESRRPGTESAFCRLTEELPVHLL